MAVKEPPQGAAATGDPGALSHRQVMTVLAGLLLCVFLSAVDATIVSTALPTIAGELGGLDKMSWIVTAYLLTSTATTPLFGKVSDLIGRQRSLQAALAVFFVGSILCGAAQDLTQLVIARAIQGIGGGGMQALAFVVLGDLLSPRERGRYMGYFTGTFALSGLAGPLIGGLVVDAGALGWRWIFYLNVPLIIVAAFVTVRVLRLLPVRHVKRRIDWEGSILLVGGVVCLLLYASFGEERGWGGGGMVALAAAGIVLCGLFIWQETRAVEPILPMRLFRDRVVAVGMALALVAGGTTMAANVYLPLFLQTVSGASATRAGLLLAPMMLTLTVTSIVAGRFLSRTGRYTPLVRTGPIVMLIGTIGLTRLDVNAEVWHATPWMLVLGVGMGMFMPPLSVAVQNAVTHNDLGVVTSANTFFRTLGQTYGVAAFGAVLFAVVRSQILDRLPDTESLDLRKLVGSPRAIRALPEEQRQVVIQAVADGVHTVYLVAVPLSVVVVVLSFLLPERALRTTTGMADARAAQPPAMD
jgi:EmrB/QacA subfamily drug resistance transporter